MSMSAIRRNPVRTVRGPCRPTYPGPEWRVWLVQDQRFVDHRPDVLTWETEPLKEDVRVAGDIVAELLASTSGTDSDWVVKLIDVYPDDIRDKEVAGYQLMIADEILRARFRNELRKAGGGAGGQGGEVHDRSAHECACVSEGHRIMVQVQSTWFPVYDRNPQKFVPNIFEAHAADYVKATQRVYRGERGGAAGGEVRRFVKGSRRTITHPALPLHHR